MDSQFGLIVVGLAGATGFGVHRAIAHPASQMFGQSFHRGSAGSIQIALTFDDGPDSIWTPLLAAKLREFRIPATFFCIGQRVEREPDILRRLADDGHEVGNHSYSHRNLWYRLPSVAREEIERCQNAVFCALGRVPTLFRPPFGDRSPSVIREARRQMLSTVLWSVNPKDWKRNAGDVLVKRVSGRLRGGDVVLFHDGSHDASTGNRIPTVEAVSSLIPFCLDRGSRFVTVSEMMKSIPRHSHE